MIFADLAPILLAPILTTLKAIMPRVEIRTRVGSLDDIAPSLGQSGTADFGITYDLGLDDSLIRRELARLPLQAVVAADHVFARSGAATMAQVAAEAIVLTRHRANSLSAMAEAVGEMIASMGSKLCIRPGDQR